MPSTTQTNNGKKNDHYYLLFTVLLHYSENGPLAEKSYCTPYCATPGDQQPNQSWKKDHHYLLSFCNSSAHSSEDQATQEIIYIKHLIVLPKESNNTKKA